MTRNTKRIGTLLGKIAIVVLTSALLAGFALAQEQSCAKPCKHSLQMFPMRFAVLGDRTGGHVPGVYEGIVKEIERLKPDFVVNVGDMIEGEGEDEAVIRKQYEEYKSLLAPLTMPLYLAPGNHDIWADSAVGLYREYIGEPDYSFDVRGVHFVVLDTGRYEKPEELRDDQIEWLKRDLEANRGAYFTIVIFHKPYWIETIARGKPDRLHDIFVANGVDAVFTGHYHVYFSAEFDGIKYTSIGSSGGGTEQDPTGLMYHFLWASFDGEKLSLAPIRADAALPWDQMTAECFLYINDMQEKAVKLGRVIVQEDLTVPWTDVNVTIKNFSADQTITDMLKWDVPQGWSVKPVQFFVKARPGETRDASFKVKCVGPLYPAPELSLRCPFRRPSDRSVSSDFVVKEELHVARTISVPMTEAPILIDGVLSEPAWRTPTVDFTAPKRLLREPTAQFFTSGGGSGATEPVDFYFAWDKDNLYLAAKCTETKMDALSASVTEHDGPIYTEDCVGYFFQTEENGPVYQMYFNPLGTAFDQRIALKDGYPEDADRSWNGDYEVKTVHGDDYWTIEVRVPLEQLGAQGAVGKTFALNFRRKQMRLKGSSDWQVPITYSPETFGILELK